MAPGLVPELGPSGAEGRNRGPRKANHPRLAVARLIPDVRVACQARRQHVLLRGRRDGFTGPRSIEVPGLEAGTYLVRATGVEGTVTKTIAAF